MCGDSYLPNNMARLQSKSRGLSTNHWSHTIMHRTGMDSRSRLTGRKRFKQFYQDQVTHREEVQPGKRFQICRLKNRSETGSIIKVCAMCAMHVLVVLHWIALSLLTFFSVSTNWSALKQHIILLPKPNHVVLLPNQNANGTYFKHFFSNYIKGHFNL